MGSDRPAGPLQLYALLLSDPRRSAGHHSGMNRISLLRACALAAFAAASWTSSSAAQQIDIGSGSVVEAVQKLRPGEYAWAPQLSPSGPTLLIVNTRTQRAILYRNGIPIAVSTVSTGRPGYGTPTGVFTILQKQIEHYSSKYNNAPMPYMQRLTWSGVALHAGQLPGYPASHGCIRLPLGFANQLYSATKVGMTVVVTGSAVTPRVAPTVEAALSGDAVSVELDGSIEWHPDKSPIGPISIIVSAADRRAIVLRNGIEIGRAPVRIEGSTVGTVAYTLRNIDADGRHWLRVPVSADQAATDEPVPAEEWKRFTTSDGFRGAVAGVLQPGATLIVTADSLRPVSPATILSGEPEAAR